MDLIHTSVLLHECIEGLNIKSDGVYVDCTLGGAGHSEEICKKLSENGVLIGIDQDEYALKRAGEKLKDYNCTKHLKRSNFKNIKDVLRELGIDSVQGVLMDLGVSSFQLDDEDRGFSYKGNGKLDMRMDRRNPLSAYNVVNEYSEKELENIIREYGEERFARRIAREIVNSRSNSPIETTGQLVQIIKRAIPARSRREGPHPAKRTFQAIRIEVNDELGILSRSLTDAVDVLDEGGRICVISFHSLEDRIVKQTYKKMENPCTCPPEFPQCVCGKSPELKIITKKPVYPSEEELKANPRARSAKLRIAEKI